MKLKEKKRNFSLSIFGGYQVRVVLTNDLNQSLEKHGFTGDEPKDTAGLALHCEKHMHSYIFLQLKEPEPGYIAHESWHVVKRICDHLGIKLDNEVVAYLLGYIVEKVHKTVNER